ncbi:MULTISPECIES: HGxxPAAW family protein [Actinomadura]|uniref:HGxxPAAW family protein n=1 Tax=Actinomadura yumaensis TaxID=111807 RepID=A0ABW2CY79_9ACTN|nr:HGxxPAAW family protein [Actinomadura sp. J1-007]
MTNRPEGTSFEPMTGQGGSHGEGSTGSHAGRPSSWVAVSIIFVGFAVGGAALCFGPSWVTFYVGVAIIVVGIIVSGLVHLFSDVVVDAPRVLPEIVDYSVFGSRSAKRRGGLAGETLDKPITTDTQQTPHG